MPRRPVHKTLQSLIQYHVSLYYVEREKDPGLIVNLEKHIEVADRIIKIYHDRLRTDHRDWENSTNQGAVKSQINFLTQIYSRQEAETEKKESIKRLKEEMSSKFKKVF